MTSYAWKNGSGNWTASKWSPGGGPPTSTDSATISVSGSAYTVTVDSADSASSLTLSSANATLNDDGASASLTIGGTLTMSNGVLNVANGTGGVLSVGALYLSGGALNVNYNGTFNLGGGTLSQTGGDSRRWPVGTIASGTINSTAGTLAFTNYGGTLSGVTFDGPLSLASTEQVVHLANGTTVVGSGGSGPGTIAVTGSNSQLYFDNSQTVGNTTITLGNSSNWQDYIYAYDSTDAGNQVLTLASTVTINEEGFYGFIGDSGGSGDGIVNQGVINQTAGNYSSVDIFGNAFTNSGTINAKATNGGPLHQSDDLR